MKRVGSAACFGSFGELLQGVLPGGHKFLINCRITNVSRVTVELSEPRFSSEKESDFAHAYARFPKTFKGLRIFLSDLGLHDDLLISIDSDIPIGKGLSSSTADMVAGVQALAEALSVKLKNEYVSKMLTEVEPNDGLHFEGTTAYHHTEGRLIANFGWVPPFRILGIEQGGVLDTVLFNQRALNWTETQTTRYAAMLESALAALDACDAPKLAEIATESAKVWQAVSPKEDLGAVLDLADDLGACGVLNTHSGTYLGLLFPDRETLDEERAAAKVAERLPRRALDWYRTTGCQHNREVHTSEKRLSLG
jgi:L-threonine kinase